MLLNGVKQQAVSLLSTAQEEDLKIRKVFLTTKFRQLLNQTNVEPIIALAFVKQSTSDDCPYVPTR